MEVKVISNPEAGSQLAYEMIRHALEDGAQVFGLATGSTPERVYELLSESDVDFSQSISVNLDEYVGLPADHPQSYHHYMHENLFNAKPFKHSYIPDGMNTEAEEIQNYNQILEENPVDLQILGIGTNGHIAFNEPGTPFDILTHKVELTESTIQANKRYFESEADVPRYAYSMGLASIMKAEKIILLAFGESKAQAIKDLVTAQEVDPMIPSTVLINHPDVTIIADEAAAKLI